MCVQDSTLKSHLYVSISIITLFIVTTINKQTTPPPKNKTHKKLTHTKKPTNHTHRDTNQKQTNKQNPNKNPPKLKNKQTTTNKKQNNLQQNKTKTFRLAARDFCYMTHSTDKKVHITAFDTPVVDHRLNQEQKKCVVGIAGKNCCF